MTRVSIIFSTLDEINNSFFSESITYFAQFQNQGLEVIVVNFQEDIEMMKFCTKHGAKFINSTENSRAMRLNQGAQKAQGKLLLFHHPRSILEKRAIPYLLENYKSLFWGGFTHIFDDQNSLILRFTSWYSNQVRSKVRGIIYLDHCIYVKRELFEKVKFAPIDIFEDTVLSNKLTTLCPPRILNYKSTTSTIRFKKNGMLRQIILNQIMKICFLLGIDHKRLNRIYEFGINLNSKYE